MKVARFISCLSACLVLALATNSTQAQQTPPNPYASACGSTTANFSVKHQPATAEPTQPPPGKALVYVIESMYHYPIVTKKVNIGLDGSWIGATEDNTHMSFTVDPGVHHLCAVYQGYADHMDEEGSTLLLRLNAESGHTYYVRVHAVLLKESPSIAFFDAVDEDEGPFLVQRTEVVTSTLKK
jgi:hypothetical protein